MNRKRFFLHLFIFCVALFPFQYSLTGKTLNHEVFLEKIKDSSDNIYKECILEYDDYLSKFPNEVSVHIEKCKFIQYAQYDEEDYYNPHQEEFDSCSNALIKQFPNHPDVLLFQTTYLWDEELQEVFDNAEKSIKENPEVWNDTQLGTIYKAMSDHFYYDSDYKQAYNYILKAISYDEQYQYSLDYARILIESGKKEKALDILKAIPDTTKNSWELRQKANLFLELKSYENALDIYKQIDQKDSTFNNNTEIASTLEGIGEYDSAREYLIADLSKNWDKEQALRNLLNHDLKYQDGSKCIETYNQFRDLGYSVDPIGFYRLNLFFRHYDLPWKFRDIAALFSLLLILNVLLLIPSIWILPVYFVGHYWNFLDREKPYISLWGLKAFWFVSAGYLIASLLSWIAEPETLYSYINSSYYELSLKNEGWESIIFMLILALFGFAALYKVNPKVLLSTSWSTGKSILLGAGILFAFKIATGIYMLIASTSFGISLEDLANIPNLLLASQQDIQGIIGASGKLVAFLLIGLLVPVYEEIIFRGVILDACQRYISFPVANFIQSILFAAVHMSLFLSPVFFVFGIITGIMRKQAGGLLPGIVFHAINNILALIVIFAR